MSAPSVLLVDDRPENLLALEAVLADVDARLVRADSGEEALRALLEEDFAAILLDVQMPGMDGYETAKMVRGRKRSAHTPIIFLTALSKDFEQVARGYEAGAVDFLLKPFEPTVLRSKVEVFVDLARHRTARERADSLLRAAWASAPNGVALVDAAGRILQANPSLERLIGRSTELGGRFDDVVVAPDDRAALAALRERLTTGAASEGTVEISLGDLTGGEVPVSVLASAVVDSTGSEWTLLLQITDLRERRRAQAVQQTLVAEQAARAEAEGLAQRLAAVAAVTDGLDGHRPAQLVDLLASRLVGVLGLDGAEVALLDADGRPGPRAAAGTPLEGDPVGLALRGQDVDLADDVRVLTLCSHGRSLGVVAVLGATRETPDSSSLLAHAVERAALVIERAQLYEREALIAATLQRDLLPDELPDVPGITVSAHFSPGGDGAQVGGDWYDAIALPGGRLGIVVGDVAGRGVAAAARMGELRSVARAYLLEGHGPSDLLRRMNAYHLALGSDTMTTLLCAVVEPDRERVRFASAGHLPPLLTPAPDRGGVPGVPHYLDALGPPLGVLEVCRYEERAVALAPGALLVLCTDGLVERRGEVLDLGLDRLRGAVADGPTDDVEIVRARILEACGTGAGDDDVTVVLIRGQELLGSPASFVLTPNPDALGAMRRQLRRWLAETGASELEIAEMTMAANEAMQNAIEHGNAYEDAPITIVLERRGDDVVIVVRDLGHDRSRTPDPDRGRGVELMNALVDDAHIDLGGPMGGTVTLRRRLVTADAPTG